MMGLMARGDIYCGMYMHKQLRCAGGSHALDNGTRGIRQELMDLLELAEEGLQDVLKDSKDSVRRDKKGCAKA